MKLRLFHFFPATRVEGPGTRACIQVQGCPIRCAGCAVPRTWPAGGGTLVDADALADGILSGPPVEGVTFLGGEPFAQAAALARIGRRVRAHGLSVVTFTGYRLDEIRAAGRKAHDDLLDVTDLLIDGPFQKEKTDYSRPWVGSSNQQFHFLTDRYAHLAQKLDTIPNRIEVRMGADGRILVHGLAPLESMAALIRGD
ncbi:MAG: radical SAM protein [Candidatus Accumulibacter sp.]|jgi:anaerobic ribonucleoside-triphosphate reductase activating protein|nr:radical SAM protein [Accumulibacter sp.]